MSLLGLPTPIGVDGFFGGLDLVLDDPSSPPPIAPDPDEEVVASFGPGAFLEPCEFGSYSPFFCRRPRHELRAMSLCPPIASSLRTLKSTVLSGGFQLTPAVAPSDDSKPDPDQELSLQILEECKRSTTRMERPLESWAWEMLDAMAFRERLSETVLEPVLDGPDKGKNGIARLATKPHWSYRYRVNRAMVVRAIDAWSVDGKWQSFEPEHFAWLSWEPEYGDPRGNSLLDSAFHAFSLLMKLWPEFFAGNRKFGTPSLFLTAGERSKPMVSVRDSAGAEIAGKKPITVERSLSIQGNQLLNGGTIGAPYGSECKVIESTRDGVAMNSAIELLEAQIIVCILLQTRATKEAQYGSKADSESGTGVLTTWAQVIRQWVCQAARKPYYTLVRANYDEDIARRLTPHVGLGRIDPRNFAAIAQAIGLLYQSGYFTEAQLLWLDGYLGMPLRRPGDLRVGPQKDNMGLDGADPQVLSILRDGIGEMKAMLSERGMAA